MTPASPPSRHFATEPLSDGVLALIAHDEGGWAIGNAGVIDLGNRTLVFDTFMTPTAARDLKALAEDLTGRPVDIVVNSHYHNDHIWGNQVFGPNARIYATETTRLLIATRGMTEEYEYYRNHASETLKKLSARRSAADSDEERARLSFAIPYYEAIVAVMPELSVRFPDVTFDRRVVFHGSRRTAELLTFGGGHTDSDALLYLPADGIIFTADLLFVNCHPYLADGDPAEARRALEQIGRLGAHTLVPGHGPVGTPEDLEQMARYIEEVRNLAHEAAYDRPESDDLRQIAMPDQYRSWGYKSFFESNLRFLIDRFRAAE